MYIFKSCTGWLINCVEWHVKALSPQTNDGDTMPVTLKAYSISLKQRAYLPSVDTLSHVFFSCIQIVIMLLIFVPLIFRAEHANDPDPGQHLWTEELKRQAGERARKIACGVQQGEHPSSAYQQMDHVCAQTSSSKVQIRLKGRVSYWNNYINNRTHEQRIIPLIEIIWFSCRPVFKQ